MPTAFPQSFAYRGRRKFSDDTSIALRALAVAGARGRLSQSGAAATAAITDNSTGVPQPALKSEVLATKAHNNTANATAVYANVTNRGTGGSYLPGNTVTAAGDTGVEPVFTVVDTEVRTAVVLASGTGPNIVGGLFTGTGGTGEKFTFTADVTANTMTNITLVNRGRYTVNPTLSPQPVTSTGYTGYTVTLTMGIKTLALTTAGSCTVLGTEPHATTTNSATGTGATLYIGWNAGIAKTIVDPAITAANNNLSIMIDNLGDWFVLLGMPRPTFGGAIGGGDTVAASTTSFATLPPGTAATAIDYSTGNAALGVIRNNVATVVRAANMVLTALGYVPFADATGGAPSNSNLPSQSPPFGGTSNAQAGVLATLALGTPAATTAGTGTPAGSTTLSHAVVSLFFANLADNLATLALAINTLRTAAITAPGLPVPIIAVD